MSKIPVIIISFCIIILNTTPQKIELKVEKENVKEYVINPLLKYDFRNLRDTVYTLKNYFIEVDLTTQYAKLFSRDGSVKEFPISSGNKKVEEGIETREGLFVLHWKAKKLYSEQFDSTLMLYWMGFNGGIGFHALAGNGYYKYLGKRNVSHGCVRMAREDAELMYSMIEKGTPVLVHKGNSTVKIAFGDERGNYFTLSNSELKNRLPERYSVIYEGQYFQKEKLKFLIDETNVTASGLPIGDATLIPVMQEITPEYLWIAPGTDEYAKINSLLDGNFVGYLTYNTNLDSKPIRTKI